MWQGTLSEGDVVLSRENLDLLKRLSDCGIINSICSKNDEDKVRLKLDELGIKDFFVFNSIDWTPKGRRISNLIKDIGLRSPNVLFVDDNITNLNEAKYYEPQIQIATPDVLPELVNYYNEIEPVDLNHSRLKNYKILEEKRESKSHYSDNIQFLFSTNTKVEVKHDCAEQIDRIYELVCRTNQLNYTKKRSSRDELLTLFADSSIDTGYVVVEDKFGEYGIVGFYAVKNNECIHFLFSCRTIGQGVEQYVYSILNFPDLHVEGEVSVCLKKEPAPAWINQDINSFDKGSKTKLSGKILFKGPCDLSSMVLNFDSTSILTEFTYIGIQHNSIEHHNHSVNYLRFPFLSKEEKEELVNECIFNDAQMFETNLFNPDVKLVFLSTLIEANLAIYKRKRDGYMLAFGEYCNDLTDKSNIEDFLNGTLYCYSNKYTKEWLCRFSENWEYCGRITSEDYLNNIKLLLNKLPSETKLCLMLGSEMPHLSNEKKAYENRHLFHKELNDMLRMYAKDNSRILLLDFNEFIHGQEDYTDNINHFQRRVYYEISQKANEYIGQVMGCQIKKKKWLKKNLEIYLPRIKGLIWRFNPSFIKNIYHSLKTRRKR